MNQQAEYYQFIYQFHSQMEAEMCALQNIATQKTPGGTPGK